MAVGALLTSSDSAKRSQALRQTMDNVNFALDSMTRYMRMGSHYSCFTSSSSVNLVTTPSANDCPLSGSTSGVMVAFMPPDDGAHDTGTAVAYKLYIRPDGTQSIQKCGVNNGITNCIDIISSDVNITDLRFYVNGSSNTDQIQPSIYILIKATVTVKGQVIPFAMQTMASQRSSE